MEDFRIFAALNRRCPRAEGAKLVARLGLLGVLATAVMAAGATNAATLRVGLNGSGTTCGNGYVALAADQVVTFDEPGPGAVEVAGSNDTGCSGEASAEGGLGYLSVYSAAEMLPVDPNDPALRDSPWRFIDGRGVGTYARASDFISFVPTRTESGEYSSEPFQISANVLFTAQSSAAFSLYNDGTLILPGATGRVGAQVRLGEWLDGTPREIANLITLSETLEETRSYTGPDDPTAGDFVQSAYSTTLTTAPVWVMPGDDLVIETRLFSQALIRGSRETIGAAVGDSRNTLAFSTVDPIFNLPDGYTVNIPEWNIVNNLWIDPRVGTPDVGVSAVPLPAGLPLLLAGLGALTLLSSKRRHV